MIKTILLGLTEYKLRFPVKKIINLKPALSYKKYSPKIHKVCYIYEKDNSLLGIVIYPKEGQINLDNTSFYGYGNDELKQFNNASTILFLLLGTSLIDKINKICGR
jgi:hypothetical protein